MRLICKMKVEALFVEGKGCRAQLRPVVPQPGSWFTTTGGIEITVHRPKEMKGLLTLGETYDMEITPAPEKPDAGQ